MKVKRRVLEERILFLLEDIIKNKDYDYTKIFKNVKNRLFSKNIMEATRILNKSIPLETVSIQVLYHLTKALYRETYREEINPNNFFTDVEIKELNLFKRELKKEMEIVEFSNLVQVTEDQWHGAMTIGEIAELYNQGKIIYNPETQRERVFKEFRGQTIVKPKIFPKSVEEITEDIINESYIPDEITFNILRNGEENFEFKGGKIFVYNGEINVIDGYNRSMAILKVVTSRPELADKRVMEVRVTNFTDEKAKRFIVQKNKQNKISERHIKSLAVGEYQNSIVKEINTNSKSDLQGKIATDLSQIKTGDAYVTFDILANSIKYCFIKNKNLIKTKRDERKTIEYLVDFLNEVYGIFYDEFNKKDSFVKSNIAFVSYIVLAAELYKDKNWRNKLESILNKIDYSYNNKEFKQLIPSNNKITTSVIKKVINYIKKYL